MLITGIELLLAGKQTCRQDVWKNIEVPRCGGLNPEHNFQFGLCKSNCNQNSPSKNREGAKGRYFLFHCYC